MTWRLWLLPTLLLPLLAGCAELRFREASYDRAFRFEADTFGFANELYRSYGYDAEGTWRSAERSPEPEYAHRCFVLSRSARQFFQHARFEPEEPALPEEELRARVRRVVTTSPRRRLAEDERIVIPGYASLRALSRDHEALLKDELGGSVWSYVERGNWRMVIPLSRRHQTTTVEELKAAIDANRPPIVHLVRFPRIEINHAVLLFGYTESEKGVDFAAYDPNAPDAPVPLAFDRATRTFLLERNAYFAGGRVDVYEIYHRLIY
ncbi:MAG TPA: hypothetical protein VNE71_04680 [Myxococcota bacterium]|nr:hypothetical protein [Myxococcota bacterium]